MENASVSVVPALQAAREAVHAAGLTASGLTDLLLKVDAEASATTKARLTVILDGFGNLPLQDGRKIMAQATKDAKGKPTEQTIRQRVSECRQLIGAVRLIEGFREGIEKAGMGWASAVSRAREELASKGIKANGDRVKSKAELAAEKAQKSVLITLAENMAGMSQEDRRDSEKVGAIAAQAAETVADIGAAVSQVKRHAEQIVKVKGMSYAVELSNAIVELFNATQSDEETEETAQAA